MATSLPALEPAGTAGVPFMRLLDQAVRLARRHFRAIYPAVALPIVPLYALIAVFQILWMGSMGTALGSDDPSAVSDIFGMGCGFMVIAVVTGLAVGLGVSAMTAAATAAAAGRPIDMGWCWRFVLRPRVLGTQLLAGLAILGSALVCCVPVLYVAPVLALVTPVMVEEGVYGSEALGRSANLVAWDPAGRPVGPPFWKVLGVFAAGVVLSWVVTFILQMPFSMARTLLVLREALEDPSMQFSSPWNWLYVPEYVLGIFGTLAVSLFNAFALALLFFDLRGRKEAPDLEAAVAAMAAMAAPPPLPPPPPTAPTEPR